MSCNHRAQALTRLGMEESLVSEKSGLFVPSRLIPACGSRRSLHLRRSESLQGRAQRREEHVFSRFVEVFVDTPLEVCEQRDEKVCTQKRDGERSKTLQASPTIMRRRKTRRSYWIS